MLAIGLPAIPADTEDTRRLDGSPPDGVTSGKRTTRRADGAARKLRILCVDDDPSCLHYLTRLFEQAGHVVRAVSTGMQALLEASAARWDLILLDRVLPDISGVEVQRRIRAREDDTPVMLVTAYPDSDGLTEAVHLGLSDYAVKPFIGSRLLEAVVRAAGRRFPLTNQPTNRSAATRI